MPPAPSQTADGGQPATPVPPPPLTPPPKPTHPAGRSSITSKAERAARDARIMELRSANVPVRQIAKMLSLDERRVREAIDRHFRENAEWAAANTLLQKWEKRHQYEMLDSLVLQTVLSFEPAVITGAKPPPAGTAPTITYRDWLGGIETSRRIKGDIVKLYGLEGLPQVKADADGQRATPGDGVYEGRVVRQFLEQVKDKHPALYDQLMSNMDADIVKAKAEEDDVPLPNGEHLPDDDGEGDVQAP